MNKSMRERQKKHKATGAANVAYDVRNRFIPPDLSGKDTHGHIITALIEAYNRGKRNGRKEVMQADRNRRLLRSL